MTDIPTPVLSPFNPLDKRNLAESITDAMLQRPVVPLPPEPFIAAGIYAIYYTGDFPLYQRISERNAGENFSQPIYVGKAVPAGARKGGLGLDAEPGQALYNRLCDHAKSVLEASNLNADDFHCRFLAVDDIWIPLAESLLIEKFALLWNRVLDGFGNQTMIPEKVVTTSKCLNGTLFIPGVIGRRNSSLTQLPLRRSPSRQEHLLSSITNSSILRLVFSVFHNHRIFQGRTICRIHHP